MNKNNRYKYVSGVGIYDNEIKDYVCDSDVLYKLNKLTDLEKELTDKNLRIASLNVQIINEYHNQDMERIKKDQRIAELEKQLEEKEKEIETYKQGVKYTLNTYSDEFVEKDKELKELRYKVSNANQDKTTFAIEQLEKIREEIKKRYDEITPELYPILHIQGCSHFNHIVQNLIEKKIKELKE